MSNEHDHDKPVGLIYPIDLDEHAEREVQEKGWLQAVYVSENGARYDVEFMDPQRVADQLRIGRSVGEPALVEPGLIIVEKVNRERMEEAIEFAVQSGFFARLCPENNVP